MACFQNIDSFNVLLFGMGASCINYEKDGDEIPVLMDTRWG